MPPTFRLEQVAKHLAARSDHRSLVTLVEKWAEVGEPTVAVRIVEARSLMELRALDRAYARVRDLVESDTPNLEALALATEIQLLCGWQTAGRKLAQKGLERDPNSKVFAALVQRAAETPTEPDDSGADSDLSSVGDLVRVAEQFLAVGQHVRARAVLERVRRKAPDHHWAQDLAWALEADFVSGDLTLADLCDRLGPDLLTIHDGADEPEHTESIRKTRLVPPPPPEPDRRFHGLFRNLTDAPAGGGGPPDTSEVTAVSSMAQHQELLQAVDLPERTDPQAEDTQILRVQPKDRGRTPAPAVGREQAPASGGRTNLAELKPRPSGPAFDLRDVPLGEDEDDSVVVHLRREDTSEDLGRAAEMAGLTEELAIEKAAEVRQGIVEDAGWARAPEPVAAPEPRPKGPRSGRTPAPVGRVSRPNSNAVRATWPAWVAVLFGLAALGAVVLVGLVLLVAWQQT